MVGDMMQQQQEQQPVNRILVLVDLIEVHKANKCSCKHGLICIAGNYLAGQTNLEMTLETIEQRN